MAGLKSVMEKQERIKKLIRLESYGFSVKEITEFLKISKSTYYRYKQEIKKDMIEVILNKIKSEFNKHFDSFKAISILSYSELSIIRSKYSLYGNNKIEKFNSVKKFLEPYLFFDFEPRKLYSKNDVKKQYFRLSKKYHPDLNKNLDNSIFISFHRNYEYLNSIAWI